MRTRPQSPRRLLPAGTCGGHEFHIGIDSTKTCEELHVHALFSSATFTLRNWTVTVREGVTDPRLNLP